MKISITGQPARDRRGLSFVEFVSCLVAMMGGVLLGSLYLGIDIQKMAVRVLEQSQIVAPGYFGQVVAVASQPAGDSASSVVSDQIAPKAQEAADKAAQAESLAAKSSNDPVTSAPIAKADPTTAERLTTTRAYWDRLTAIMLTEAQGRLRGEGKPEEWELYDYLSQRKRGHEEALVELEKLDTFGVDDRLLGHGEQVIAWHKAGIKLFDNALSLLSDGPGAKLTGPFAQSWQSAATQLRMEENLVIERHKAVANYLDREYANAAPFVPAFQQQ